MGNEKFYKHIENRLGGIDASSLHSSDIARMAFYRAIEDALEDIHKADDPVQKLADVAYGTACEWRDFIW